MLGVRANWRSSIVLAVTALSKPVRSNASDSSRGCQNSKRMIHLRLPGFDIAL
jgi:hypothetical protein